MNNDNLHRETIKAYIQSKKGWTEDKYRLAWVRLDDGCDVVNVISERDSSTTSPGGGESVQLYIDRKTGKIRKELAFQ